MSYMLTISLQVSNRNSILSFRPQYFILSFGHKAIGEVRMVNEESQCEYFNVVFNDLSIHFWP